MIPDYLCWTPSEVDNYLDSLADLCRMKKSDVTAVVLSAERRYKTYFISKRNGGLRQIAHPARELKTLQRALIKISPDNLAVHESASAYEPGRSIQKNAQLHLSSEWLAKFDFEDFFNSITADSWRQFLETQGIEQPYIDISSRLFFWKRGASRIMRLSVGAPSSPFASNRFMYPFDVEVSEFCRSHNLTYSRYADDIAISSSEKIDIKSLEQKLISCLPDYWKGSLNDVKTKLLGPGNRKTVTGLVLSNDGRVTVGRSRRRKIEAMVCNYCRGDRAINQQVIAGNLAFLKMVDRDAYVRLKSKFGKNQDLFSSASK
ncbi:MAG: retron St85 family RNA-directed DNA polymerase [Parasphingorhabdus sp.]